MQAELKQKIWFEIVEWTKSLVFAAVVGVLILLFARPSFVIGPSMEPTFYDKAVVLVQKISYLMDEPKRYDVVVAKTNLPLNQWMDKNVIKRVIGLPGDHILIQDGRVVINGTVVDEPYVRDGMTNGHFEGTVPEDHVFVMGDNRLNSNDSRGSDIGYIAYDDLKGKVYFQLFPFSQIGKI